MDGSLKLESNGGQPQLAVVAIVYSDLPRIDLEPITLFADSTTTAGYAIVHYY